MNSSQTLLRRLLIHRPLNLSHHRVTIISSTTSPSFHGHNCYSTTSARSAMQPGTKIPGLDAIYPKPKDKGDSASSSAPAAKPRNEYPSWVSSLAEAPPTLAKLRNMNIEEASDKDMKRYLKLVRRNTIKDNNAIAGNQ